MREGISSSMEQILSCTKSKPIINWATNFPRIHHAEVFFRNISNTSILDDGSSNCASHNILFYSGFMSTRHSHMERIKISSAHVLSLFLNNFLELAYSIPKMMLHTRLFGFIYDNITSGLERDKRIIFFFFLLAFCSALPDFLVQAAVSHARDWFRDTYSIS